MFCLEIMSDFEHKEPGHFQEAGYLWIAVTGS